MAVGFKLDYVKANGDLSTYTPDFIVRTKDGVVWIVETKGREELDVPQKMLRLKQWCEDATKASKDDWGADFRFGYVDQGGLLAIQATNLCRTGNQFHRLPIVAMSPETLKELLDSLTAAWENEVLEFKDASDNFSTSDIGKYFSAIANEANLRDRVSGWLVFGVSDKTHTIIGTSYREGSNRLMSLKQQIADGVDPEFSVPARTATWSWQRPSTHTTGQDATQRRSR